MKYYIVDAFADEAFKGNPAGVCILDREIDDALMQSIAFENNLSETAFVLKRDGYYGLRWFTPKLEIDLCGHATLGSAFVITNFVDPNAQEIKFDTRSGMLSVKKRERLYELDFPMRKPQKTDITEAMAHAVGMPVLEAHVFARDLLLVLESEQQVQNAAPDFDLLRPLAEHAVAITAKGNVSDFVSRFFAPNVGIPEDPVTGSAHTILTPFWAEKLGKTKMTAKQLSKRGGTLFCESCENRVKISGKAVLYLSGEIHI